MSSEDKLGRIEAKIDKLSDKIGSIDVTLAAQHQSLKEHIRRTNLLELAMDPVKKHVAMMSGGLKLLALVGLIMGSIEGAVVLLEFLKK